MSEGKGGGEEGGLGIPRRENESAGTTQSRYGVPAEYLGKFVLGYVMSMEVLHEERYQYGLLLYMINMLVRR